MPNSLPDRLLRAIAALAVLVALGFAAQAVAVNSYYASIGFSMCFWAVAASAYNLSAGYAGELSLGHGAFLGLGAYSSTLLFTRDGVSPWVGMVLGAALAAVLALVIGVVAIRLRGPYFAIVTLAVVLVLNYFAAGLPKLTQGAIGINISGDASFAHVIFTHRWAYVLLMFGLLVIVTAGMRSLVRSRFGYRLAAYRENEDAARSLGIATTRVRVVALVLSAAITAVAGSLQAQYLQFISPDSAFSVNFSVQVALMAIIGGLGTVYGPILGAVLIVYLGQLLQPLVQKLAGLDQVVYGAILILVLLFLRRGIAGLGRQLPLRRWLDRAWTSATRRGPGGKGDADRDAGLNPSAEGGPA
jgi:branched-chain amino acid transport system permease protein